MGDIKTLRTEKKLTQQQVADMVGISLRSYKSYENEKEKEGTLKYNYILDKLRSINPIDEEHGILEKDYIIEKCTSLENLRRNRNGIFTIGGYFPGQFFEGAKWTTNPVPWDHCLLR